MSPMKGGVRARKFSLPMAHMSRPRMRNCCSTTPSSENSLMAQCSQRPTSTSDHKRGSRRFQRKRTNNKQQKGNRGVSRFSFFFWFRFSFGVVGGGIGTFFLFFFVRLFGGCHRVPVGTRWPDEKNGTPALQRGPPQNPVKPGKTRYNPVKLVQSRKKNRKT